ncbi:ABC transporter ATP-binding protein [Nocardiopsis flavescens]|uniref:ABC transporter ATP-binding protein n=1 Tax=Nocardiopsis flavescens TaxID=758803 RepID=UPI003650CCB0
MTEDPGHVPGTASSRPGGGAFPPVPALHATGLRRSFGGTVAVDGVDLLVPAGSFFGVVGPNGAGKSTSLLMAVGLLRPDAGTARIFGVDVWADPVRAKRMVGVLPDGLALPERLTGRELLHYLGRLDGLDGASAARRADDLLRLFSLDGTGRTAVGEYSTGMRKKIGLATALLNAPRLLVLDEPFEAVDPVSGAVIRGLLERFVADGGSVVLSSHSMSLVEELCDRVAVIVAGRTAREGTLDEVRRGESLHDAFAGLLGASTANVEMPAWLRR